MNFPLQVRVASSLPWMKYWGHSKHFLPYRFYAFQHLFLYVYSTFFAQNTLPPTTFPSLCKSLSSDSHLYLSPLTYSSTKCCNCILIKCMHVFLPDEMWVFQGKGPCSFTVLQFSCFLACLLPSLPLCPSPTHSF